MFMIVGALIGIVFITLFGSLTLWIVAKLKIGLSISRTRAIFVTAFAIAISGVLGDQLLSWIGLLPAGGVSSAIIHFVTTVLVLLGADWLLPGVDIKGIRGAVLAAVAMAAASVVLALIVSALAPALSAWVDAQASWQDASQATSDAAAAGASGAAEAAEGAAGNFQVAIDWANRPIGAIIVGIGLGIAILLIGRWLARVITRYASRSMERAHMDPMVVRFLAAVIRVGLLVAIVIAALNAAGIHTTSLTALLASAGVAIGLALQDSLANVAAGLMILVNKPYHVGDFVEAGGVTGIIKEVSVFNTIMRTADNVKLYVPNSTIVSGNIKNYSDSATRRIDMIIGIGYDANVGLARDILMDILTSHPAVLEDPAPRVTVWELGPSTMNLAVWPWVASGDYLTARGELMEQIVARFAEAGVSMPYPTQEVIVHEA